MMAKIFGIGLAKTGTSSLDVALKILGYKSIHYPVSMEEIDRHEASCDLYVAYRFKELDRLYPGSKFILTIRDLNQWLDSCENHFGKKVNFSDLPPKLREFLQINRLLSFGTKTYDRVLFKEAYQRHIQEVKDYFNRRPQNFLIMNISSGEGWERLCHFLGCPIPDTPFPQENVACGSLEEMFRDMTIRLESIPPSPARDIS